MKSAKNYTQGQSQLHTMVLNHLQPTKYHLLQVGCIRLKMKCVNDIIHNEDNDELIGTNWIRLWERWCTSVKSYLWTALFVVIQSLNSIINIFFKVNMVSLSFKWPWPCNGTTSHSWVGLKLVPSRQHVLVLQDLSSNFPTANERVYLNLKKSNKFTSTL